MTDTLLEKFKKEFADNEFAITYLEWLRWKDGVVCPYCKSDKTCRNRTRGRPKRWQCWNCSSNFTVTVHTLFHNSNLPLNKWFLLIYLMLKENQKLSWSQVAKELNIRRATAGTLIKRINAAKDTDQMYLLKGIIEWKG